MNRSWILVGMMGAGKSSLGRALADISMREFVDTDQLLQVRLGRSIPQIFQVYGEETFRAHETSILRSLEPGPTVLSTGGGIVLRSENWDEMRRLGIVIYLEADADILIERLDKSKKKRPLLQVEAWQERLERLLQERQPLYEQADIRFKVGHLGIEDAAAMLYERLMSLDQ